jgi:hypothetical protein
MVDWEQIARITRAIAAHRTGKNIYTYEVEDSVQAIRLHLELNVMSGSMLWRLSDSRGLLLWEGAAATGEEVKETRRFEPVSGKWDLQIIFKEAVGDFDVLWAAKSRT